MPQSRLACGQAFCRRTCDRSFPSVAPSPRDGVQVRRRRVLTSSVRATGSGSGCGNRVTREHRRCGGSAQSRKSGPPHVSSRFSTRGVQGHFTAPGYAVYVIWVVLSVIFLWPRDAPKSIACSASSFIHNYLPYPPPSPQGL